MTKFRRYASGDKPVFTASQLNAINEAALAHSQGKSQTLQAERLRQRTGNHFPVANSTEDDLPAFSVLELQRALIEPTDNETVYKSAIQFNGVKPTEESILTFSITQQYLSAGAIDAGAIVSGVSFARITGPTGATLAKVANNAYTLLSDEAGNIPVLYDPGEDTGERIAIVRLSGGGGSACTEQYALWFSGRPTGGTTSLPIDVDGTLESVVIDWDAAGTAPDGYAGSSQAYIDTALATHSLISLADITVTDPGGKLPHHVMRFYFTGDTAAQEISFGIQTDSFTGGSSPYSTLDKCCG